MKDLGKLKYFFGFEVARNDIGFFLSQPKYAFDIIADACLLGDKPSLVLVEVNHKRASVTGPLANAQQYHHLIG